MQPRERLIFPLDVPNKLEAESLISRLTTGHVDQGPKMLQAMVASLKDGAKVLGVTVLTHLGPDDLEALGIASRYAKDPSQLVLLRARLAKEAGCDGGVCAGTEARAA